MNSPSPLESILLHEIASSLQVFGPSRFDRESTLLRIRSTLYSESLDPTEAELAWEAIEGTASANPIAQSEWLSRRIRRALIDGAAVASGGRNSASPAGLPDVRAVNIDDFAGRSFDPLVGLSSSARNAMREFLTRDAPAGRPVLVLTHGRHSECEAEIDQSLHARDPLWDEAGEATVSAAHSRTPRHVQVRRISTDLGQLASLFARLRPQNSTPSRLAVGDRLDGKYRIVRQLGRGGFGSVYEAIDERVEARVAIKLLDGQRSPVDRRAFLDEARRLTRLNHPNIVQWRVFDQTVDGRAYFVMEYVEGEELGAVLANDGRLDPRRVGRILLQALDALRAAHHLGEHESILHLDLKPSNIFLVRGKDGARDERIKLIDFGIGQYIAAESAHSTRMETTAPESNEGSDVERTPTISLNRELAGSGGRVRRCQGCTPEYASPEQCAHLMTGRPIVQLDGRSDIYSLGVIAFRMLTGRLPFEVQADRREYLRLHCDVAPTALDSTGVRVSRELRMFVERCLEKDRNRRWSDAQSAYEALDRIVRPRRATWPVVASFMGVAALSIVALKLLGERGVPAATISSFVSAADGHRVDECCFGPMRRSVELKLAEALDGDEEQFFTLVDADAHPVESVQMTIEGGVIRLDVPTPETLTSDGTRVRLASFVEGGACEFRSSPILLRYLAAEAATFGTLQWSGVPNSDPRERPSRVSGHSLLEVSIQLDPTLQLDAPKPTVWFEFDEEGSGAAVKPTSEVSDDRRLTCNFVALALTPDAADRTTQEHVVTGKFVLRDVADRLEELPIRFTFVFDPLTVDAEVVALDGFEINPTSFPYFPGDEPIWRLGFNRPARLTRMEWSHDGEARELPRALAALVSASPSRAFDVPLAELLRTTPGGGRNGLTVQFTDTVLSADSFLVAAQPLSTELKFTAYAPKRELGARLRLPSETQLVPMVDADRTYCRVDERVRLVLGRTSSSDLALDVLIRWGKTEGAQGSTETIGVDAFGANAGRADWERDMSFDAGAGAYQLEVESRVRRTPTVSVAPFTERIVLISTDVCAELGEIDRGDWPLCVEVRPTESPSFDLRWQAPTGTASDAIAPVTRVRWRLERRDRVAAGTDVSWSLVHPGASIDVIDTSSCVWSPPLDVFESVENGRHRWVVWTEDAARRRSSERSLEFDVAFQSPQAWIREPLKSDRVWKATGESFVVSGDARGMHYPISSLTVALASKRGDRELRMSQTAEFEPDASGRWRCEFALGDDWSGLEVDITVTARAELGPAGIAVTTTRMPSIQRPTWESIQVSRLDAPSVEIEPMHLVRGNSTFTFALGVHDNEAERARFAEFGMAEFSPQRSPQEWCVRLPDGAISNYYLDEHEVSFAQFMAFVEAPSGWENPTHWRAGGPRPEWRDYWSARITPEDASVPAAPVLFEEAVAYAAWVGKRLPALAELEYAARGGRHYWPSIAAVAHRQREAGSPQTLDRSVVNWNPTPTMTPGAGRLWGHGEGDDVPSSVDWPRLRNLTGNASEWTSTPPFRHTQGLSEEARRALVAEPWRAELNAADYPHMLMFGASARIGRPHALYNTPMRRSERRGVGDAHEFIGFRCALSENEIHRFPSGDAPSVAYFRYPNSHLPAKRK